MFFVVGKLYFSASIPLTCVTASRLFQSGEVAPDHHKLYAAQVELSIKVPCSLLTADKFLTWARLGGGTPISWEEWLTDGEAVDTWESQPAEQDVWAPSFLPFLLLLSLFIGIFFFQVVNLLSNNPFTVPLVSPCLSHCIAVLRDCYCIESLSCVWLFRIPCTEATRLLCPWNFPGKNIGVGCHFLLHY